MNKVLIAIVGVVIIGGGAYAYMGMQKEEMMPEQDMMEEKAMMEKEAMMQQDSMKDEAMMEKDGEMMQDADAAMSDTKDEPVMAKAGSYEAYSPEKLARAATGDVVLFFHASWCPSCRGLSADIESNLAAIPAGVTVLKVDYDTATELKKMYGVTTQHTLVQVSAEGTLLKKWSGGPTLAGVVAQIQ